MFTYATILMGSIVVAAIALVVYRVVMGSSRSILSSKEPISLVSSTPYSRAKQTPLAVADAPAWPGEKINAAPGHLPRTQTSTPSENTDFDWQIKENKVSAQRGHHEPGTSDTKHCSLYEVDPTAQPANLGDAWPHREDKVEAAGKAYKVTRKMPPQASNKEDSGKPWGW